MKPQDYHRIFCHYEFDILPDPGLPVPGEVISRGTERLLHKSKAKKKGSEGQLQDYFAKKTKS